MKMIKQLICPISNEYINERVTRINALLGLLLMITGIVFNSVIFMAFLAADFYTRAFSKAKYSPISYVSHRLVNALNLNKKGIDKAPKILQHELVF